MKLLEEPRSHYHRRKVGAGGETVEEAALNATVLGTRMQRTPPGWTDFNMKEPIVIVDGNDLDIFETVLEAARYLEPVDLGIENSFVFDSEGRILEAIECENATGVQTVEILDNSHGSNKPVLRKALHLFLVNVGYQEDKITELGLGELIDEAIKFKSI